MITSNYLQNNTGTLLFVHEIRLNAPITSTTTTQRDITCSKGHVRPSTVQVPRSKAISWKCENKGIIARRNNFRCFALYFRLPSEFIQHQDCAEFYTIPLNSKRLPTSCGRGRRRWRRVGDLHHRLVGKQGSRRQIGARLPFVGDAPSCGKSVSTQKYSMKFLFFMYVCFNCIVFCSTEFWCFFFNIKIIILKDRTSEIS